MANGNMTSNIFKNNVKIHQKYQMKIKEIRQIMSEINHKIIELQEMLPWFSMAITWQKHEKLPVWQMAI